MGTARFWSKVNKTDTCWLWNGWIDRDGYGRVSLGGTSTGAHRFSYEDQVGPIPDGLEIDHVCRVRNCVRPDHLEPVTHRENLRRKSPVTHCKHGHEYTPENTYQRLDRGGWRHCRACHVLASKRYKQKRRTA